MKRIIDPDTKEAIDIFGVILTPSGIYMVLIKDDDGGACDFDEVIELRAKILYQDEFLASHPHHVGKYYYWKGFGKDNPMEELIENNEIGSSGLKKETPL